MAFAKQTPSQLFIGFNPIDFKTKSAKINKARLIEYKKKLNSSLKKIYN